MSTKGNSVSPMNAHFFPNQNKTISPLKLSTQQRSVQYGAPIHRSSRIRKPRRRSSEHELSMKRRINGGFCSSMCCKGILAALITTTVLAAFILPFTILFTMEKGTEVTTTVTTSATSNVTTSVTGTTTTSVTTTSSTKSSTTTTALNTGWNTTAAIVAGTGVAGKGPAQFNGSVALALDSSKTLYISDRYNHRVQKWLKGASSGTTIAGSSSGTSGSGPNYLDEPLDVGLDSSGNIYIADGDNHRIVLWNVNATSGIVVAGTGTNGSANNQLSRPYGIAHDWTTGILYIADSYNDRIMSYAPGNLTGTFCIGGTGLGTTQLKFPTGLYFDSSSNSLYIANTGANNIVRWVVGASNWVLVAGSSSGTSGSSSTLLDYPRDVTLDYMKNVYVADADNNRIQFFRAGQTNGTTIAGSTVGTAGSSSVLLDSPIALLVDINFDIYVADYFNRRVQRFDHY